MVAKPAAEVDAALAAAPADATREADLAVAAAAADAAGAEEAGDPAARDAGLAAEAEEFEEEPSSADYSPSKARNKILSIFLLLNAKPEALSVKSEAQNLPRWSQWSRSSPRTRQVWLERCTSCGPSQDPCLRFDGSRRPSAECALHSYSVASLRTAGATLESASAESGG